VSDPTSLYVHIPFCARKCPYCGFFSRAGCNELIPAYVDALKRELAAAPRGLPLRSVYIGGGTPTMLSAGELADLLRTIGELTDLEPGCEFTVEANPGTLDAHKVTALLEGGVNRVSLGAQSFHARTLEALGRIHGPDEIRRSVETLRAHGCRNIGLDLMYAVPGQTVEQWSTDLESAVALDAQHISTYGLSFDDGTEFAERRRHGKLAEAPDEAYLEMNDRARERLCAEGFEHYEISNFARPGCRSAHNCNYWFNGSYLGIGASAAAFVGGERRTNVADIPEYIEKIRSNGSAAVFSERLNPEDFARETAAFNIRYLPGIDRQSFLDRTGCDLEALFADMIDSYIGQGLLEYDGEVLRLTTRALPVADSVSAAFLKE